MLNRTRCVIPALALTCWALTNPLVYAETQPEPLVWQPLNEPGNGGRMTSVQVSPHDPNRMLAAGDMLSAALSTDGGRTWQSTFGFRSYEQGDSTWHPTNPNTVWLGTMSGPYVSHDGGTTWHERRGGMPPLHDFNYSAPIERVLFDPNNPDRLIAFGGSSRGWHSWKRGKGSRFGVIWQSTDAGENWTALSTVLHDGGYAEDVSQEGAVLTAGAFAAGSSSRLYMAGNAIGVQLSEDGGNTWADRTEGLPHPTVHRLVTHPTDPDTLYVSLLQGPSIDGVHPPGGVFRSNDAGQTWTALNTGLTQVSHANPNQASAYYALAIAPTDPDVLYTSDRSYRIGVIYRSTNGGESWTPVATKKHVGTGLGHLNADMDTLDHSELVVIKPAAYRPGLGKEFMAIDPNNPNIALGISSSELTLTRDGGKSFEVPMAVLVEEDTPFGMAWRGAGYSGLVSKKVLFDPQTPGRAIIQGMDQARIWLSNDDLQTWTYHGEGRGPWGGGQNAVFASDGTIYATFGQYKFFELARSRDRGKTWTVFNGPDHGLPEFNTVERPRGLHVHPTDSNLVYSVIGDKLYRTTDGGEQWAVIFEDAKLGWIAPDPSNPDAFYVTSYEGVFHTTDGENFINIGGPDQGGRAVVDDSGRLYVVSWRRGDTAGLWRYHNGTWDRIWDQRYVKAIAVDPHDNNRLAVGTADHPYHDATHATGLYLSDDAGKTWHPANNGLPMRRVNTVGFDPHTPGRLIAGTGGRGFWKTHWPLGMPAAPPAPMQDADHTEDFDKKNDNITYSVKTDEGGWTFADGLATVTQNGPFGSSAAATLHLDNAAAFTASTTLQLEHTDYSNGRVELVAQSPRADLGGAWQPSGFSVAIRTEYGPPKYFLELYHGKDKLAGVLIPTNPSAIDSVQLWLEAQPGPNGSINLTGRLVGLAEGDVEVSADTDAVPTQFKKAYFGIRTAVMSKNKFAVAIDRLAIDLD
ncbi:MAG: hypothetical protein AAF797_00765 [Planctomycetota bacterium]